MHSFFEFSGHLAKFTVIEQLIETLPCGRVVVRGMLQPVRENSSATLLCILLFCPHLKLLPGNYQITQISPLVYDGLLQFKLSYLSTLVLPPDDSQIKGSGLG